MMSSKPSQKSSVENVPCSNLKAFGVVHTVSSELSSQPDGCGAFSVVTGSIQWTGISFSERDLDSAN